MNVYDYKKVVYWIVRYEVGYWFVVYILGWDLKKIELKVFSLENSYYGYVLCVYKVNLEIICDVRDYVCGRVKVFYCGVYVDGYDGYNFDYERIGCEMGCIGGVYFDFWKVEEIYFFYYNCFESKGDWEYEFNFIVNDVKLLVRMYYDFFDFVGNYVKDKVLNIGDVIEIIFDIFKILFIESKIRFFFYQFIVKKFVLVGFLMLE